MKCQECGKSGEYAWGRCPYCGTNYPSQVLLPTSLRMAHLLDLTSPEAPKDRKSMEHAIKKLMDSELEGRKP